MMPLKTPADAPLDSAHTVPQAARRRSDESPAPGPDSGPVPSLPGGRPRALDLAAKKRIVGMIWKGCTISQAAAFVACCRDTVRNERKRDPDFDFNVRRALAMRNIEPLEMVVQASRKSWRAAAWLLEYRRKLRLDRQEQRAEQAARREGAKKRRPAPEKKPTVWVASNRFSAMAPIPSSPAASPFSEPPEQLQSSRPAAFSPASRTGRPAPSEDNGAHAAAARPPVATSPVAPAPSPPAPESISAPKPVSAAFDVAPPPGHAAEVQAPPPFAAASPIRVSRRRAPKNDATGLPVPPCQLMPTSPVRQPLPPGPRAAEENVSPVAENRQSGKEPPGIAAGDKTSHAAGR